MKKKKRGGVKKKKKRSYYSHHLDAVILWRAANRKNMRETDSAIEKLSESLNDRRALYESLGIYNRDTIDLLVEQDRRQTLVSAMTYDTINSRKHREWRSKRGARDQDATEQLLSEIAKRYKAYEARGISPHLITHKIAEALVRDGIRDKISDGWVQTLLLKLGLKKRRTAKKT